MVGEKSGTIRIFSIETLKPVYSLLCLNENLKTMSFPLLNFDWSQINPEAIVAISNGEIFLWNTSKSWYSVFSNLRLKLNFKLQVELNYGLK
jgi:WD40 repeat protein